MDPRVLYKQALVQHELDAAAYKEALARYEADYKAHEEALVAYTEMEVAYKQAVEKREALIEDKARDMAVERKNLENRLAVAKLRRDFLAALSKQLARLTEPALEMLQSLKSPRVALRRRAEAIRDLFESAEGLLHRVRALFHRAEAGSLVGFQVQREEVAHNLKEEIQSLRNRAERGRRLAEELLKLADEIESDGREQRLKILVSAKSKEVSEIMDRAFTEHLRESRRASRASTGFALTDADIARVRGDLVAVLQKPETISAVADGKKALLDVRAACEGYDKILDAVPLGLDRHRQAYRREMITVYSCLASLEVKNKAYSFSYAFLEDFIADFNILKVDLSLWAESRLNAVSKIATHAQSLEGRLRIARVGGGLVLILFFIAMRHRIRNRTARVILRLINLRVFRRRAGLVVRLTVFGLAMMPIVLVAVSGYALLYLIGMDYPETRIAEIAFRWGIFYFVGRQIVLGLTRTERTGRPPLFEISPENFKLLRKTYARLGLFLAVVAAGDEWSREWLGTGSFNTMVRFMATFWLGVWILWAMAAWRRSMAVSAARLVKDGSPLHRAAAFTRDHFIGIVLTPFLFAFLILVSLFRAFRKILAEGHFLAYFRARALRRMSRKTRVEDSIAPPLALPKGYRDQFPLYPLHGEEGEVLLPRSREMEKVRAQIANWRTLKQDGSLVLIGEKGIGKTTFLALLESEIGGIRASRHVFKEKLRSETELSSDMGRALGMDVRDVESLALKLNEGEQRVILLDEAHNIFLRTVDGFRAVDALASLVDSTSEKVFWVLVFNCYSWSFLKKANRHVSAFRRVLLLPPWSQDELKDLVAKRNARSGIQVEFDEVLLDAETSSTGGFELISSADGFFRLLWEASRGNPRVATYLWLKSLTALSDRRIKVGLIREENASFLSSLDSQMYFALASVAQHENLSYEELGRALNVSADEAVHAGRFLLEYGLIEPKHTDANRLTLAPRFHQQVIRSLTSRHLLYLED